mgnify:CR=1 FL=1
MFYETPGADLFFAPNNLSQNTIYAPKDIENFLCFCGLDCHFIEVDSAPQVLTYHFHLKNKTQNTRSALIALRRKLHDEKIVERPSQKADIAIFGLPPNQQNYFTPFHMIFTELTSYNF